MHLELALAMSVTRRHLYTDIILIKLMKWIAFRKHSLHEKTTASVLLNEQERPLMQSIKGRRLIVYACVICWTTRNNQGQSPLSL